MNCNISSTIVTRVPVKHVISGLQEAPSAMASLFILASSPIRDAVSTLVSSLCFVQDNYSFTKDAIRRLNAIDYTEKSV